MPGEAPYDAHAAARRLLGHFRRTTLTTEAWFEEVLAPALALTHETGVRAAPAEPLAGGYEIFPDPATGVELYRPLPPPPPRSSGTASDSNPNISKEG